jgi:hypothetical protein
MCRGKGPLPFASEQNNFWMKLKKKKEKGFITFKKSIIDKVKLEDVH